MSDTDAVRAVVDVHEPDELLAAVLAHPDITDVNPDVPLETADLIVNGIGFERKTPSDYVGSLTSGRLTRQVKELADAFDAAYVLVEGDMADFESLAHSGLPARSARGSMASFAARDGVPVLCCSDVDGLVDMAVRLGRKHTETPTRDVLPAPDLDDVPPLVAVYASLPGVGPQTARTLHAEFTDVRELLAACEDGRVTDLDGIGPKTAESIRTGLTGQVEA